MNFTDDFDTQDVVEMVDMVLSLWGEDKDIFEAIFDMDDEKLFEFSETMALTLVDVNQQHVATAPEFSFTANGSLGGAPYPCASLGCRLKKIDQLAVFSVFYADCVYINNTFEDFILHKPETISDRDRKELCNGVAIYLYLKPLIKQGIVRYSKNQRNFCLNHFEKIAKPKLNEIKRKEEKLFHILRNYLLSKVVVTLEKTEQHGGFLRFSGPLEFFDHEFIFSYLTEKGFSKYKSKTNGVLPYKFTVREIDELGLIDNKINEIVNDLGRQQWHSYAANTTNLCDGKLKMSLAKRMNSNSLALESNVFEESISHNLPIAYSKDLGQILDLRNKESESFSVYRDKMRNLMSESRGMTKKELTECFKDTIKPELNKIDKSIDDWQKSLKSNIRQKIVFGSGAVMVGLFSGVMPLGAGSMLASLFGGGAYGSALSDANKLLQADLQARSSDYYFLWKINQLK